MALAGVLKYSYEVMEFFFSDHFLMQIKERRISKRLAKSIYLRATKRYFDTSTDHHVVIDKRKHLGKMRSIMVAYDAIIRGEKENYVSEANLIDDEIWFVTAYPLKDKEIENRVKSGRCVLKNEKN